ncbi:MAG: hypothetical protein OEV40_23945 [Acidimicrobiia bacterium]|nr:hypothetical protein [Acidimicrobiia bacterium]
MSRPAVDPVAPGPRRDRTLLASSSLAATVLAAMVYATALGPAEAVAAPREADALAVVQISLLHEDSVIEQTEPAPGVIDHGHEEVVLASVTVGADAPMRLVPRHGAVEIVDLAYPVDVAGVAVSENGAQTPVNTAGFESAAARALASHDLRDYIRADHLSRPGTEWGHDFDLVFDAPLLAGDGLLVVERNGNSRARLTPLGADGHPLSDGAALTVDGSGWNTGFAPGDRTPAQPLHVNVVDVAAFLGDGPGAAVHGVRVDNDDEADLKLLPLVVEGTAGPLAPSAGQVDPSPLPATAGGHGAIAVLKQVYVGHDGGAGCDRAASYAEAGQDDAVTYCFTVTNTGTAHLADIVVADPLAGGTPTLVAADSVPLAPGDSARYHLEATPPPDDADGYLDDTYINTATVTATPVDGAGEPVDGAVPVMATGEAVVFPAEGEHVPSPDVSLVVSVYPGSDAGAACPAAKSTVVGLGAPVTFCFTVTNTGNTHLDSIDLTDPALDATPTLLRADSQPLAPGDSAHYYVESTGPAALGAGLFTATAVTANAVDATGADLVGLADVTSSDDAQVTSPRPPAEGTPSVTDDPADQPQAATEPQAGAASAAPSGTQTTGSGSAEAVTELAYTGWETWAVAVVGVLLIVGGWLLLHPGATLPVPARPRAGRPPARPGSQ